MKPILVGAIIDSRPQTTSRAELVRRAGPPDARSTYDAAQTTDDNRRYWLAADGWSAPWANNPGVRRAVRNRSRYECANGNYLRGSVRTSTHDIVGRRGPKARFNFPDASELNAFCDREFAAWLKAIGFRRKFKTFVRAKKVDGEGIALLATNPKMMTPVKLDIRLIEAEQLSSPLSVYGRMGEVSDRFGASIEWMTDGILFDRHGNPVEYHVLKNHPGDGFQADPSAFSRLGPESVIHWFDVERPGQVRGIPETQAALPLSAMLRRFTKASLAAAEIQADFAGVLETTAAPEAGEPSAELQTLELEPGLIPSIPYGQKLAALQTTQPTATYGSFKREVLSEMGRGNSQPYNVMACDSSSHNYSSARLDTQEYQDEIEIERFDAEEVALDRLAYAWLTEAAKIPAYLPAEVDLDEPVPCEWFWPGFAYIDPVKENTAIQIRLENNLTTLKKEHAKNGDDWREVIDQRSEEIAYCQRKGVPLAMALPAPASPDHPTNKPSDEPASAPVRPPAEREEALAWTR